MVEASDPREAIAQALLQEYKATVEAIPEMKIAEEDKKKGIIIYTRDLASHNDTPQFVLKHTAMGVVPEQLCKIMADIRKFQIVNAERVEKYVVLSEGDLPSGIKTQTYASHGKGNLVISGRLSLDTKYYFPEQNLFLTSSRENQAIRQEYRAAHKKETDPLTEAFTILFAQHFKPVLDGDGKVVGTEIVQVVATEMGGSVPLWMIRKMAPKVMPDIIEGLIAESKKA